MKSAKNLSELFPNKLTNWKKFSFKNLKKDQLLILLLAGILLMVIADGGGNAVVKENISSAVQALFDIEPHKIRIMKKQMN